jgi:LacI family transcriptional regulator
LVYSAMASQKRVTLRDVANLAGVSNAVVSYVINNGPRPTSSEVRERVLQAIAELDYHPSALARSLSAQRTQTIGYIASDYYPMLVFTSPYSSGILTGLVTETKAQGYYLMVYPIGVDEDLGQLQTLLRSGRLDGIVLRLVHESPVTDPLLEMIASVGIPCVCIEQAGHPRFNFCTVSFDDLGGAYKATAYLIEQGHRRIAHIQGDLRYASARLRKDGYKQALSEAGIAEDENLILGGTWESKDAIEATHRFLALDAPPTAIFAANDSAAFAVIDTLRNRGLQIPGDIAVIGFDDIPLAREMNPALTSIRVPLVDLGRRAARIALQLAGSTTTDCESESLSAELILRETA